MTHDDQPQEGYFFDGVKKGTPQAGDLCFLVPRGHVARAGALIVLQIAEERRIDGHGEGERLPRSDGDDAGGHREAVQIAGDGARHVRDLLGLKVIRSVEANVPVLRRFDVAAEAQVVANLIVAL